MEGEKEIIGERFIPKPGQHEITVFFSAPGFDEAAIRSFVTSIVVEQGAADFDVIFEQEDNDALVWKCIIMIESIGFREAEQVAAKLVSGETAVVAPGMPTIVTDLALRESSLVALEEFYLPVRKPVADRDIGGLAVVASGHSQPPAV